MASKAYEIAFKLGAKLDKQYGSTFQQAENIASKTISKIVKVAAAVGGAVLSANAIKDSVDKAMSFESSMADVAKVVDGLKDSAGNATQAYAVMSDEILDMTARLPMAADEITKLIAAAGQSGIAANELTRFAEDAAKMGVAFDLPAERAGELAAVIRSSLGMTQDEFVVLADKINYFGNTTTQSADKLIEVVQAAGLIGKQAGINADQIAAMGAAVSGLDAANMGTALSNIYGALMDGPNATAAASKAWESLGFTSEQVAKDMLADSEGTMIKIFEAMKKIPEDLLPSTSSAIFGDNKSTKIALAAFTENLGVLKQNFQDIGDATKYAGSMQNEFSTRAATTENKVQLAKNAIDRLKITLGNLLLPVVAKGATLFGDAINFITGKASSLTDKLKSLGDSAITLFTGLRAKAATAFTGIKDTAITTFNNIKQVIDDNAPVFQNLIAVALNLKGKLFAAFNSAKPVIEWLFTVGLPKVTGLFLNIIDGAAKVYQKLDEWKAIEPIIAGIVTGFVTFKSAMAITSTISGITNSVKALTTALAVQGATMQASAAKQALAVIGMKAYAVASGLLKGQLTLQAAATGMATAFQTAFNIVMAANPIGMIVLGVAALVAAIVAATILIIKNWDKIKTFFIGVWEKIKTVFDGIGAWFGEKFTAARDKIKEVFSGLASWFYNSVITPILNVVVPLINFIVGVQSIVWDAISALWSTVAGWYYTNVIQPLIGFFSGFWQSITSFFQMAWDGVSAVWAVASGWFSETVIAPVTEFFSGLWTAIVGFFQAAWDGVTGIWLAIASWVDVNVIQPIVNFFSGIPDKLSAAGEAIANKLKSIFCGPIDWIKEKWSGVTEFFSGILGQVDKITERGAAVTGLKVTSVPGYASGSSYTPSTFIAGERGPELITNAAGSKVFTAIETGNIMPKLFDITENFLKFDNLFGTKDGSGDTGTSEKPLNRFFKETAGISKTDFSVSITNNITFASGSENNPNLRKQVKDGLMDYKDEIVALIRNTVAGDKRREMRISFE